MEDFKHKNVLLCGGAGFIGSWLADRLVDLGAAVVIIDPCMEGTGGCKENLSQIVDKITWIQEPIEGVRELKGILRDMDVVIDSMGATGHQIAMKNIVYDAHLNYLNHVCLLEALNEVPVKTIFLGSRTQYGKLTTGIDEQSPQIPVDVQGVHKCAAESVFRIFSQIRGLQCISVRIGNCFGPRQQFIGEDLGLIGGFIKELLQGQKVKVYNSIQRVRYFIYIEELVDSVLKLAELEIQGFTPVNIVGQAISLGQLLEILQGLIGEGSWEEVPFPQLIKDIDPGEGVISQEVLNSLISVREPIPFIYSLGKTITYFKEVLINDMEM